MAMWPIMRRSRKSVLMLMLLVILLLNVAVFVGVPGAVRSEPEPYGAGGRSFDYSHLQARRKRLNKSFNNSESVHHSQLDIEELGKQMHPEANEDEADDNFDDVRHNKHGGYQEHEGDHEERNSLNFAQVNPIQNSAEVNKPRGLGCRANYSLVEVDEFALVFQDRYAKTPYKIGNVNQSYYDTLEAITKLKRRGARLRAYINNKGVKAWERFHYGVRQHSLYDSRDVYIDKLLKDMQTKEIVDIEHKEGGTQIKLIITFADEGQALFKPMRFKREQETLPDHFYFADYERHIAEIAAFHLDRVLGFNRVPPTTGRFMNASRDIERLANSKLAKTFFWSPAKNLCFHGTCSYYCDSSHPICGNPWMLEGSLAAFLPPFAMAKRKTWRNPWKRSYSKHRKAYWEVYSDLCDKVKVKHPYSEGRRLLDVLDMAVFDFLTGNLDRHHYETFKEFGNDTFLLHLDNGRAFGKSQYDCVSCLAPVRQCCMIRLSTLAKLLKLYQGPQSLSEVMRDSLSHDPVAPILIEPHLDALDRRVSKILHIINGCVDGGKDWEDVVIDDGVT